MDDVEKGHGPAVLAGDAAAAAGEEAESVPTADVELLNIHKTYLLGLEGVAALRGVSLRIEHGEWVIVYGTSGGGKTSLLNIIGTIDKPTKGELRVCDVLIQPNTPDDTLANIRLEKLGFVFQTFNLLPTLNAIENVELPMVMHGQLSRQERRQRAEYSLEKVGLGHRMFHYPHKLSGGEQQRVTIARAIANSPKVLLLDEPTGDLDTVNTRRVMALLHNLNREQKMTMIMVTHDVSLKHFAHRVVYMRDGKVARIETVPDAQRNKAWADLQAEAAANKTIAEEAQGSGGPITVFKDPREYATYSKQSDAILSLLPPLPIGSANYSMPPAASKQQSLLSVQVPPAMPSALASATAAAAVSAATAPPLAALSIATNVV